MIRTLHLGIIGEQGTYPGTDLVDAIPDGMDSDGDSFLVWGEGGFDTADPEDHTLHITLTIPDWTEESALRVIIREARIVLDDLTQHYREPYRLVDYAVVTDHDDWSEHQRVWVLDGSITPA